MPDEHEKQQASSIRAYVQLLLSNRIFRILWLGEVSQSKGGSLPDTARTCLFLHCVFFFTGCAMRSCAVRT